MYELKDTSPEFTVMDGPLALKQYRHGERYEVIPPDMSDCFLCVGADEPTDKLQYDEEV